MKITNNYNLPEPVYQAILNDNYSGPKHDSDKISLTSLIGPVRMYFLKRRHWGDLEEDAADMLWRIMGQLVHALLERSGVKNKIVEERIEEEIDGVTISGQMDVMDEIEIADYKFTSVWQYIHAPDGKKEYIAQLNGLRWLVRNIFKNINKLSNHLILRDWSKGKAKQGGDYPEKGFASINIPIWSYEDTEKYLKERVAIFKANAFVDDKDLPLCSPDEMWEKPTTYAIIKKGGKRAINGGVCSTMEEAKSKLPPGCEIVVRHGSRGRCEDYCSVNRFCSQYQKYLKEKGDK